MFNDNAISWVFPFSNARTSRWLRSLHTTSVELIWSMHIGMGIYSRKTPKSMEAYICHAVQKSAQTNSSGRLTTAPEDLKVLQKTNDFCGRFVKSIPEDLSTAPEQLLIATEHFRNCSVALTALRLEDLQMFRKTYTSSRSLISLINCSGILTNCSGTLTYCSGTLW